MSKIAMVGDRDSIWAFKAFRLSLYFVKDGEEKEVLARALTGNYSIIFVTEGVFRACREQIDEIRDKTLPSITVLPNLRGSQGLGTEEIKRAVRKAVGADIL